MKHILGIYISGSLWQKVHLEDYPEFLKGKPIMIGRRESCDICVPNNTVSREHAYLEFDGKDVYLVDNGSLNKLKVNGRSYDRIKLKNEMKVTIGTEADGGAVVLMYIESGDKTTGAINRNSGKNQGFFQHKRLLAFMADMAMVMFMCIGFCGIIATAFGFGGIIKYILFFGVLFIGVMYFAVSESAPGSSSFGKNIFSLKVVSDKGDNLSFKRALLRTLAKFLSLFTLFLPVFGRGRCLHDVIAKTNVIKRRKK